MSPMRRLLVLLGLGGGVWWWLQRRRRDDERVTIGYEDGSSLTLGTDAPERERLLTLGRQAFGR